MVLVPHGIRMPAGEVVESESLYDGRSAAAALCAEAGQRGLVGRRRDRHRASGNYGNPIAPRRRGPWQRVRAAARRAVHPRPRADRRRCSATRRWRSPSLRPKSGFYDYDAKYTDGMTEHVCPAQIPDDDPRRGDDDGARRAPPARLPGRLALGFPLGRRAGRRRAVSARGQHPARHDAAQPGARAGAGIAGIDYAELVERIVEEAL